MCQRKVDIKKILHVEQKEIKGNISNLTLKDIQYMRYQTPGNIEFQLKNKYLPLIANLKYTRCSTVFVENKFYFYRLGSFPNTR